MAHTGGTLGGAAGSASPERLLRMLRRSAACLLCIPSYQAACRACHIGPGPHPRQPGSQGSVSRAEAACADTRSVSNLSDMRTTRRRHGAHDRARHAAAVSIRPHLTGRRASRMPPTTPTLARNATISDMAAPGRRIQTTTGGGGRDDAPCTFSRLHRPDPDDAPCTCGRGLGGLGGLEGPA
jgi:hypothetical protein